MAKTISHDSRQLVRAPAFRTHVRFASWSTLLALTLLCSRATAEPSDPWWGRDKALHFGVSIGLSAGGYAAGSLFLDERWQRAAFGAGFSLTLGAGKEAYDATGRGDPSAKDFTWDVLGTVVGTGLALLVDVLVQPQKREPSTRAAQLGHH